MIHDLDFPASGIERINLCNSAAACDPPWESLTEKEKIIFIQGMHKGYYQGQRNQAQNTIDRMTMALVGFKP